jgi:hypothetical protein
MDLFSNDGRRIETVEDWRDRGDPARGSERAEGRSARELARAWVERDAARQVTALLTALPAFSGLVLDRGVTEKPTRFDDLAGDPHRHDLLVTGRSPDGPVAIGVLARADEPFDDPLDAWITRARALGGAAARLDRLTTAYFGTTLDTDPLLAPLRYQLLAAFAATLADAREQAAAAAVLLVHEFETQWTNADLHRRNAEDLDAFVGKLMPGVERTGDDRAWIAGPLPVADSGDAYVAKLLTRAPA